MFGQQTCMTRHALISYQLRGYYVHPALALFKQRLIADRWPLPYVLHREEEIKAKVGASLSQVRKQIGQSLSLI